MLPPTRCSGIGNLDQEVACNLVESTELVLQAVRRIEEFPVDVELALIPGAITDAYRAAGTPSSQVIERATRDSQFRQELLRDPNGTLERELGVNIAAGVEIRVVEETPSTLYLVLPPQPIAAGQELSDRELERVAGGAWSDQTACGSCGAGCDQGV